MTDRKQIRDSYQNCVDRYTNRVDFIERQSVWIGRLRAATFIPAVIFAWVGLVSTSNSWIWYVAAALFFVAFAVLAGFHETLSRQAIEIKHRRNMNLVQLARLNRHWEHIPEPVIKVPREHQSVSKDLDLFGRASLFQLVSMAHTPFGRETLRDWLLQPATPDQIAARQQAVSILAPDDRFRDELDVRGRMLGATDDGSKAFVQWADGPTWLAQRSWLTWLTRALTLGVVLVVIVGIFGWIDAGLSWLAFLVIITANIIINVAYAGKIHEIFNYVTSRNHDVQHYRPLFEAIASLPADCSFFKNLRSNLGESPREPIRLLNHLMRIIRFENLRRDALFGLPYLLSQVIVLTDFHVLHFLEIWQQRHGHAVRRWLETVGQLEAISSLATLAHDNPDWVLPDVRNSTEKVVEAKSLGHVLLTDDACVRNDVKVGPSSTFLLVTGSNMSGKSTLLRAIGVNLSLAQAGGPVCAREFGLPPVLLATSMRINDSLADGVSFFMAELKRLKQIVDQSREQQDANERTLFYLLDEILQGTNSAERHIAVSKVIGHLLKHGSIGAVSTHDLELADSPDLSSACQTIHFRETILGEGNQQQMTFDYKLQPGLAPTTNALKLLELVGLAD